METDTGDEAPVAEMLKRELIATKNPQNPFDLKTAYGQYTCIQAVLQEYNNKLRLQKLVRKPDTDPMKDAETLQTEYNKWEQEVSIMAEKQSKFKLQPTPPNEQDVISKAESLLSNTDYQPADYLTACAALAMDPERPRLEGMKLSYIFQPWQVTGIYRMVQKYDDPSAKAILLADATGLGKTHQILGFWYYVSTGEGLTTQT